MQEHESPQNNGLKMLMANVDQAAALLKAMSNQNRLLILCALYENEMSVGEMNAVIPLSQSALSQHLASLRKARLVSTRRDSQTIYYRINGEASNQVLTVLKDVYCPVRRKPH